MSIKKHISEIKFDDNNFNVGTEFGNGLLRKSIERFGFREAGVMDKNGVLIGGNKRTEMAGELGYEEVEVIKADPNKVYHLQYEDIDLDTPQGRELALALNQTAKKNINIDAIAASEILEGVVEDWGITETYDEEDEEDEPMVLEPEEANYKTISLHLSKHNAEKFEEAAQLLQYKYGLKNISETVLKVILEEGLKAKPDKTGQ